MDVKQGCDMDNDDDDDERDMLDKGKVSPRSAFDLPLYWRDCAESTVQVLERIRIGRVTEEEVGPSRK